MSNQAVYSCAALSVLPPRIAKPLERLLNIGHLDEITLQTVIDAAGLAGDYNKALGFTSSYLFMRSKGVPVGDVIAMSKLYNRKVKLDWSMKRWQTEHEKLSRVASLNVLSDKKTVYDVSFFENNILESFPGYLIKTSRRLGMEGLRQRHCVASYESRILQGATAIASVFVDQTRWTVELLKTSNEAIPISIGQIKTKFNDIADKAVRSKVYQMLGIATPNHVPERSASDEQSLRETNLARIIHVLRSLNVTDVEVCFAGCGDSGSIHEINITPSPEGEHKITLLTNKRDYHEGVWIVVEEDVELSLDDAIHEVVYDYLEMTGVNWADGDGGQGKFNINFNNGTFDLDVEENYTEITTGYANEWSFDELPIANN